MKGRNTMFLNTFFKKIIFCIILTFANINICFAEDTNWYDNFIFKNTSFTFELIRTLGQTYAGGADIGECIATARQINDGDINGWYTEWLKTANRLNDFALQSQKDNHAISASEAFFRASNYYRTASFYAVAKEDRPKAIGAWGESVRTFQEAIKTMNNAQIIRIPYNNTTLPGYYFIANPTSSAPAPLLIVMTGFDGTGEELYFEIGFSALKRGYNVLIFEGPGQGELIMKQNIPFRPDWEAVVSSVLDYAVKIPNIRQNQIAFIGFSMGGYFAPRACAFESRINACIANGGVWDLYESMLMNIPKDGRELLTSDPKKFDDMIYEVMKKDVTASWFYNNGMWRFSADSPSKLMEKLKPYSLKNVAHLIKMPTLIIQGESDKLLPGQAKLLYDAIQGPKTFLLFTKAETAQAHCQEGALAYANEAILDWLDKTFQEMQIKTPEIESQKLKIR